MSLLDAFSENFILMDKRRMPDGEGGFFTSYVETDVVLRMAVAHNTTIQARQAEREGTASTYTFFPEKGVELELNDVVKRVGGNWPWDKLDFENGEIKEAPQYFRITSNTGDKETPAFSVLNRGYVTAERWVLPK